MDCILRSDDGESFRAVLPDARRDAILRDLDAIAHVLAQSGRFRAGGESAAETGGRARLRAPAEARSAAPAARRRRGR